MIINDETYNTFIASTAAPFNPPATPTDVFTLTGSSTANVYVVEMGISTTQTTAGLNAWYLAKRSTANTAGTSAGLTEVPLQSTLGTATATALQYTVNPTTGTLVGNVWCGYVNSPDVAADGPGALNPTVVNFESLYGKPLALLSTSEVVAWNFAGAALPAGLAVLAWVKWFEISKT